MRFTRGRAPVPPPSDRRPLRVAHICGGTLTGSTRVVLNLLRHHDRRVVEPSACFYAVVPPDPPVLDETNAIGVEWASVVKRARYDAFSIVRLAQALRRLRPDVVAAHGFGAYASGLPAARLARVPALVRVEHHPELYNRLRHAVSRATARLADSTIFVSRFMRGYLESQRIRLPAPEVIYNGVDLAPFLAVDTPVLDGSRPPTILMSARMDVSKDHATLLEAVAILRRRGTALRLRLSHTGPFQPALEEQARRLAIADVTEFVGHHPDLPRLIGEADVSVLSTHEEGFGLVVVEAMAAARPVIATRVTALPEVIESEEHGLLVPHRSPEALADALARLLADPARARAMGLAGRERAVARFAIAPSVAAYERHFLRTAGRGA